MKGSQPASVGTFDCPWHTVLYRSTAGGFPVLSSEKMARERGEGLKSGQEWRGVVGKREVTCDERCSGMLCDVIARPSFLPESFLAPSVLGNVTDVYIRTMCMTDILLAKYY